MQTDQKIKDLELQKSKLFGKALKLFPNSKEQLKVRSEIDKISDEISKLKKIGFMTAKQKAAREKFKKVVAEAGKLRKKNPKLTQAQAVKQAWAMSYSKAGKSKKVAAIKIIEKGESKSAKPKATYQQVRTKKGTYKGLKKVGAMDKSHKDTKSHNVNIRVVSGYKKPMYSMGNVDTKKLLDQFAKEGKLKKDVVAILKSKAKDYSNDYKSLLKDILYNGLQSGIISELVYYSDTLKWYNKHKAEIKMLLRESMMNYGTNNPADLFGRNWDQDDPFVEETGNKNLLAWFSFEETAREIANNLGYDI